MKRRTFITGLTALSAAPMALAQSGGISLDRVSAYFNAFETARARFTQFNGDGTRSTGTLFMRRPGRARFEYDPPEETLVLAGGGQIAIFDGKSNLDRPEQYPLRRTPLYLILERNVDLDERDMVIGQRFDGTVTTIIAQDPENPQYGFLEMMFTDNPVALRQWVVVDGSGARTTIVLDDLVIGEELSSTMFSIRLEEERRQR